MASIREACGLVTAKRLSYGKEDSQSWPKIAVLVPCYNEAATVGRVVHDFLTFLPQAQVFVYDNNSTDRTVQVALEAGATVRSVMKQGKGHVIRRMFSDVEADIFILVDGDDTYSAHEAPLMVEKLVVNRLDMVVGVRTTEDGDAYRTGHRFGNKVLTWMVTRIFGNAFSDILSGYRVLSRRFVKSFPALANGFETETEITVHALELNMPVGEVPTNYRSRPTGSLSKLHTYRDGWRIFRTIISLIKAERPLVFFSFLAGLLSAVAIVLIIPILITYQKTGQVPRFPTAILSMGLFLAAFLSVTSGLVLDTITRGRREMKRLFYLSIPHHGSLVEYERDER